MRAFNGSAYIDGPITWQPFELTLAANASHNSTANAACFLSVSAVGGSENSSSLYFRGDTGGDPVQLRHVMNTVTTTIFTANSAAGYSASTMVVAVGRAQSGAAAIFKDGTKTTASMSTTSQANLSKLSIGEIFINTGAVGNEKVTGNVARVGIWLGGISDRDADAYNKGAPIPRIKPASLRYYAPLARELQELKGRVALTDHSTTVAARHVRSYFGA
ncbi:MAG: hypothetical protein V4750_06055 [Pseudomonadota bacterium]